MPAEEAREATTQALAGEALSSPSSHSLSLSQDFFVGVIIPNIIFKTFLLG